MTRLLALALGVMVVAMSGCYAVRPQCHRYSTLGGVKRICSASAAQIDAHCKKSATHNDLGQPLTRRVSCCYKPDKKLIWVSEQDWDCVAHELCHADGRPDAECHRVRARR